MSGDLVAFLRARLNEDAERQTNPLTAWHSRDCASLPEPGQYSFECDCGVPERLVAEVEAKRRILAEHALNGWVCDTCDNGEVEQVFPCPTLRLLALPYADHPDYREEWRP
jgi:hypothetical protein